MKRQRMLVRHAPAEGLYGDCYRCAVATLLNLDAAEVPHVFENGEDGPTAHARMDAWLRARGLSPIWIAFNGDTTLAMIMEGIEHQNPGLPFIVGGESIPGCGHFVVCQHGRIVCDPSPTGLGLGGPMEGFWHVGFIGSAIVLGSAA